VIYQARDIFDEAIQTVTTVCEFTQVFDAYAQFEELALSQKMEEASKRTLPNQEGEFEFELVF
jgi:pre-mRNA-splicing factor SYF1